MQHKPISYLVLGAFFFALTQQACLPSSTPYPNRPPEQVVAEAEAWSKTFEAYIKKWLDGQTPPNIPDALIPTGIADSKNFYLKNPEQVSSGETWAIRYAKPIDKSALYAGIPDPKVTYLYLGTCLAPFGSRLVIEGEFPHCRFFSIQVSPPLNGKEYYAQRVYGTAEVSVADVDVEPLPGNINPFRIGANRNATNRKYRMEFDLTTGNPTVLNEGAHEYPYRKGNYRRKAAMITYQGPLGFKTVAGTNLEKPGDWNLGALWIRYYEPDDQVGALGGVPLPKVWFELPDGRKYFVGSDFSALQKRADLTIANRVTAPSGNNTRWDSDPSTGWFKSWGITRSMLNGVCLANNWSRVDSGARVNAIDLGWTGRGESQPAPGNIEPHATTNNYASYFGRTLSLPAGYVAVLTGKLPTFPQTRKGEPIMTGGQLRYWSICGIDQDPLSPLPATTIHAISDDDVVLDHERNYIIAYSREKERPANATTNNGVSWVDWGTQSTHGLLMRWVCVAPEWDFPWAPHENRLDWARSDWSGSKYDSTLIGVNWRNGFMQCYLPKIHLMKKSEFEALGTQLNAEKIPVWVDSSYSRGPAESLLGKIEASSVLDAQAENAAKNANDGNVNTAWSSAFGQQNASIMIDLGTPKAISAIKLMWDFIFFAKNYIVEGSNDQSNWVQIIKAENENGQIDLYKNIENTKMRYLRLRMLQPNLAYYRLAEFEVYTNDCNCNAPTSSVKPLHHSPKAEASIFPNPSSDIVFYKVEDEQIGMLTLFDMKGTAIQRHTVNNDHGQFSLGDLPKGCYIVLFEGNNWRAQKKVLKW